MKTYESISFDKKTYKGRSLDIKGWGHYLIASTSLQKKLLDEDGDYRSEEAQIIDEQIFFFIPLNHYKFSDKELEKQILKTVSLKTPISPNRFSQ